jgi:hypothetical protein
MTPKRKELVEKLTNSQRKNFLGWGRKMEMGMEMG